MLCWFTGVFGILLVLACFGFLFHFLMSHFHFPSVLDLCVIFLLLPNLSLRSFFNDKIAHICGAVAFIPGGLLSSCAAMHAAFPRLLHASAFMSPTSLHGHNERKHNVHSKQKQTSL